MSEFPFDDSAFEAFLVWATDRQAEMAELANQLGEFRDKYQSACRKYNAMRAECDELLQQMNLIGSKHAMLHTEILDRWILLMRPPGKTTIFSSPAGSLPQ